MLICAAHQSQRAALNRRNGRIGPSVAWSYRPWRLVALTSYRLKLLQVVCFLRFLFRMSDIDASKYEGGGQGNSLAL